MKKKIAGLLVLILIAGAVWGWQASAGTAVGTAVRQQLSAYLPESLQPAVNGEEDVVRASGIIEADTVEIASEFGGRITAMPLHAGDAVAVGQLLVTLDTAVLDAQIAAAQAGVAVAQAGLDQAQAGARPTQIAIAEAQLAQAQAGQWASQQVVSDTMALVANPQDIRLQIAVTQAQVTAADQRIAEAVAEKDAIELAKNKFEELNDEWGGGGRQKFLVSSGSLDGIPGDILEQIGDVSDGVYSVRDYELHISGNHYELYKWVTVNLPLSLHLTPNQWWQAWVGVNAASAQRDGLQASLGQLYAQYTHPQTLEANVDGAFAAWTQAQAQVALAQAQVDGYEAGATTAQLNLLTAQLNQAQAMLDALLAQRELMTLTALTDGVVVDEVLHPGEVAAPGATLLTVARLHDLHLRVYVPETQLGQVFVGQAVQVTVDSFPQQVFVGEVTGIGDQAEFTPRNVTTAAERALLVFAVEIRLPNTDGLLKPGMPADVVIGGR
ncbi:MAG: efflux RND transporter periplasmic adaptor subunit [Chloroflexota bacterium]